MLCFKGFFEEKKKEKEKKEQELKESLMRSYSLRSGDTSKKRPEPEGKLNLEYVFIIF